MVVLKRGNRKQEGLSYLLNRLGLELTVNDPLSFEAPCSHVTLLPCCRF